jgi:hypothetical protein
MNSINKELIKFNEFSFFFIEFKLYFIKFIGF